MASEPIKPTPRARGRRAVAQRLRRLKRTAGLCEHCQARGIVRLATVVDHKIPLSRGGLDVDENTQNLCDEHNRDVTAEQFNYRRRRVEIGIDGWPVPGGGDVKP